MSKYEGKLLKLGNIDISNRMFSKDCEIKFPNKIPVMFNFRSDATLGYSDILLDDDGLKCEANITRTGFIDDVYYVGGFYRDVKQHFENGVQVIDSCRLVSMSIVSDPADKELKIRKIDNL